MRLLGTCRPPSRNSSKFLIEARTVDEHNACLVSRAHRVDGPVSRLHGRGHVRGEFRGRPGGDARHPQASRHLFQLCRHDHAQLHVRGRLFVSPGNTPPARPDRGGTDLHQVPRQKPGTGSGLAGDVRRGRLRRQALGRPAWLRIVAPHRRDSQSQPLGDAGDHWRQPDVPHAGDRGAAERWQSPSWHA